MHLSLVLTLTSADYDSCPKETLSTVGVRHRF
jgi:hypothetical protein